MNCLKSLIYERFNEDFNVLSENQNRAIIVFDNSDISVVINKQEKQVLILVPLSKAHTFEYHADWLLVDGERIDSDVFWQEFGNQVIEFQGDAPIAISCIMDKIKAEFNIY